MGNRAPPSSKRSSTQGLYQFLTDSKDREGGFGCEGLSATCSIGIAYPGSGDDAHDVSDESEYDRTFLVF